MSPPPEGSDHPVGPPPGSGRGSPDTSSHGPVRPGGTIALQGCLFGSVALFVVMLVLLVGLAYLRFREQTGDPAPASPPAPALMIDG